MPITAQQFGDRDLRETLIREKGMTVLQFYSDQHRDTPVDVFVTEPFPFDEEYARAMVKRFSDGPSVRFVSIPALIALKEQAGRPEDRLDIHYLKQRLEDQSNG